jgi:hypothetical protein
MGEDTQDVKERGMGSLIFGAGSITFASHCSGLP